MRNDEILDEFEPAPNPKLPPPRKPKPVSDGNYKLAFLAFMLLIGFIRIMRVSSPNTADLNIIKSSATKNTPINIDSLRERTQREIRAVQESREKQALENAPQ